METASYKQLGMISHLLTRSGLATSATIAPVMERVKMLSVAEASEIIAIFKSWRKNEEIRDLDLPRFYLTEKGIIV